MYEYDNGIFARKVVRFNTNARAQHGDDDVARDFQTTLVGDMYLYGMNAFLLLLIFHLHPISCETLAIIKW